MTKKIWITGASSGIGKALAIKFAKEGWQVAASARRENLLNELEKVNSNIYSFPLDVVDLESSKKIFNEIIGKLGGIDLCVFSTGTYDPKTERQVNVEQIKNVFNDKIYDIINFCFLILSNSFNYYF